MNELQPLEESLVASGIRILSRVPYERENSSGKVVGWWKYQFLVGEHEGEFAISELALRRLNPESWVEKITKSCLAIGG